MLKTVPFSGCTSEQYEVYLNGQRVDCAWSRISAVPYSRKWTGEQRAESQTMPMPFVTFAADERVDVRVVGLPKPEQAVIRPLSASVKFDVSESGICFSLQRPGTYLLETDGGNVIAFLYRGLLNTLARETKTNTVFFGAGIHRPGRIELKSNQTLMIAPGAVVYGSVFALNATGIRICGGGVLCGSEIEREGENVLLSSGDGQALNLEDEAAFEAQFRERKCTFGGIQLYGCKKVEISNIILTDSPVNAVTLAACERVRMKEIFILGQWRYDAGGIAIVNSRDVRMENCFVRSFGDCVALKGMEGFQGDVSDIQIRHSMFVCDWGRTLTVGEETAVKEIRDAVFEDLDLVHCAHAFLGILVRGAAEICHVDFRSIRMEITSSDKPPLYQLDLRKEYSEPEISVPPVVADFAVMGNAEDEESEPGEIHDITVKNLHLRTDEGCAAPEFRLEGFGPRSGIRNVAISGIYWNGMRMTDPETIGILVNAYVSKIAFS